MLTKGSIESSRSIPPGPAICDLPAALTLHGMHDLTRLQHLRLAPTRLGHEVHATRPS